MKILTQKTSTALSSPLDLLVIPVTEKTVPKVVAKSNYKEIIEHHIKNGDLTDQAGSSVLFYPNGKSQTIKRILLVQLGKNKTTNQGETLAKALKAVAHKYQKVGIILPTSHEKEAGKLCLDSILFNNFQFFHHKTNIKDSDKHKIESFILFSDKNIDKAISESQIINNAVETIRHLASQPSNKMTPKNLSAATVAMANKRKIKVTVFDEKTLEKMGCGGITGVSQGSHEDACLIAMEYNPKAKFTVALVGKGITFDSGGISIKPSKDMHEMKFDMIGGATVIACLQAASDLKLPIRLIGVVAAAENLPSGKALKPGDIVTTYSGKTVEVLNTDAEGRMVLADGLSYVQKHYKPNLIIDLATLTGAVVVALGNQITGAFGNNEKLNDKIKLAAKTANEPLHFMPLHSGYKDELKSSVADLANIGKQRFDAIIGALFLQEFIEKQTPWVHLDIAGTAWNNEGPTGVMLETIINFLKTASKR